MVLPAWRGVSSQAGDTAPHYRSEEKTILTIVSCFTSLPCTVPSTSGGGGDEPVLRAEHGSTSFLQALLLNQK